MWLIILSILFLIGIIQLVLKAGYVSKYAEALVFIVLIIFFLYSGQGGMRGQLMLVSPLVLTLAFALTKSSVTKKYKRYYLPILSLALMPFVGANFNYFDRAITFSLAVALLPLLGYAVVLLTFWKAQWIEKIFKHESGSDLHPALELIAVGLLIFLSYFLGGPFGIFLVSMGVMLYSFADDANSSNAAYALLGIALSSVVLQNLELELSDITVGKNGAALFIGAGGSALILFAGSLQHRNFSLLYIFGVLCLIIGLTFGDMVNSNFGGSETLVPVMIGVSLFLLVNKSSMAAQLLFPFLLMLTFFVNKGEVQGNLIQIELDKSSSQNSMQTKVEDPFDVNGQAIDDLTGAYSIDEEKSLINFQLGPKGGITKGSITNLQGEFILDKDLIKAKVKVEMQVIKLTTFNKYRDESLMDEAYFNEKRHPQMSFSSTSWKKKGDFYELEGTFNMLGKTNKELVKLKYLGMENSQPLFIGKGIIDRTKYGMTPDSKEGNEVSYEFAVRLQP